MRTKKLVRSPSAAQRRWKTENTRESTENASARRDDGFRGENREFEFKLYFPQQSDERVSQ